jgi:hypothetical protein
MFKYENMVKIKDEEELNINDYFTNLDKYNKNYKYRPSISNLLESNFKENIKKLDFINEKEEKEKINNFIGDYTNEKNDKYQENYNIGNIEKPKKILIFPTINFNQINNNIDYEIINCLFDLNSIEDLHFSTGYLNMPDFLIDILRKKDYNFSAFTSSPQANSFFKGGFIKKHIPNIYRNYEKQLLQQIPRTKLFEFIRENWTFHSKGLWIKEK